MIFRSILFSEFYSGRLIETEGNDLVLFTTLILNVLLSESKTLPIPVFLPKKGLL